MSEKRTSKKKGIWLPIRATARFRQSGLRLIRIDEAFHVGIIDVIFVDDGEPGSDQGRDRLTGQMRIGRNYSKIPDLGRMLGDGDIHVPRLDLADDRSRRVKCHYFHLPGHPTLLRTVCRAHRRKKICAKYTG